MANFVEPQVTIFVVKDLEIQFAIGLFSIIREERN